MPGVGNSVITPVVVIRATWLASDSVSQRLPSAPAAMLTGCAPVVGSANSVIAPPGVMRPTVSCHSVNHTLPSGPAAIPYGEPDPGSANSVIAPLGVIRPILPAPYSVNQRLP